MKQSRFVFPVLAAFATAAILASPAHAGEKAKAKESATFGETIASWFEDLGESFSDSFSGPKRTAAPFKWTGKVAAGKTVEVRGVNGPIRATVSNGADVELVAIRSGRRNDPETVKIDVVPHSGGVTICAVYPSKDADNPNVCKPGGGGMKVRNNDVNVEFELRVPKGVAFEGRTVNGGIDADVDGEAAVSTVNGGIDIHAGSLTEATTVNGSISATVRTGRGPSEDIKLSTVNGSVHLSLPEDVNADVSAKTVNGGITSEFAEVETRQKWGPRSASGRIGSGGRELEVSTVNGGIRITKGSER